MKFAVLAYATQRGLTNNIPAASGAARCPGQDRPAARLARESLAQSLWAPGLSRAQATDILWAMTSPQLYRLFVTERGWPVGAFREWLTSQLIHALLAETVQ